MTEPKWEIWVDNAWVPRDDCTYGPGTLAAKGQRVFDPRTKSAEKGKANAVTRRSARQRMMGGASGAGLVVAAALVSAAALATGPEKAAPNRTVRLIVDYGDGVEKHFTALAFREGMTVMDALKAAATKL